MASLRIGVLTASDTRSEAEDTAGAALIALSKERGWEVVAYRVCRDDRECIGGALIRMADIENADVVFTCGGTGLSRRDVTPEATLDVADREASGIAEYLRSESLKVTKRAMLSRAVSAARGNTLIVNFPGSEKAARESFGFIADQLEHAVEMMAGGGHG
ncbi:MAG TPA: MogA/MoaB family molybdenum cofactor biosynthesis protein [Coriobacteriia bacterium]|nr:MogA/MoaB family molybdenum cofactor biosynthesis protein [Coriobacteriia bacterium]